MAEVLPCQQFNPMGRIRDHENMEPGARCLQPSAYNGPEPNPVFVFPLEPEMKGVVPASSQESSKMERGRGTNSMNRSKPHRLAINPLPPFDFNPSLNDSSTPPTTSPARSPRNRTSFPFHAGGHRRNGSEFIGGDSRSGGQGLQSTSPTKGEGALPTPTSARTPPLGNRPRHAHRRSGAISSHDVSKIIKPSPEERGSSAPATPAMASASLASEFPSKITDSEAIDRTAPENSSPPPRPRGTPSVDGLPRARVGFSDTIEFIPRPLSTISSETSSSLSTILASHSVTGSITSIVSGGASSPPSTKAARAASDIMFDQDTSPPRAHTTGPTLNAPRKEFRSVDTIFPSERPWSSSAAEHLVHGNPIVPSSASNGGISGETQSQASTSSADHSFRQEAEQNRLTASFGKWEPSQTQNLRRLRVSSPGTDLTRPRTSPERKVVKRPRKVKSWAGSILSRKIGRPDIDDQIAIRRSPTPPPPRLAPEDEFCLDDVNFDEDTTCVIRTPTDPIINQSMRSPPISPWKPRQSTPAAELDESCNVLDLDTVIGALSSTEAGGAWDMDDPASRGFNVARRRMHSSGATGGFSGPGMHYHRRADSLPEMAAFSYQAFGFPCLSSNPLMADVFEEEEDDEKDPSNEEKAIVQSETNPEISIASDPGVEIDDGDEAESILLGDREVVKSDEGGRPVPVAQFGNEHSNSSPRSEDPPEDFGAVEIVNAEEEPRVSETAKPPHKTTPSPLYPIDPFLPRPSSAPIDFAVRRFGPPFATPESSCVSSPDYNRTSFDTPRMHTANSSITDRVTLGSCRTGETGLSLRASVDDVPSLTSSASMISARAPRFSRHSGNRTDIDLPSSLSMERGSTSHGVAGKRSSLASLSRLVGSSYGEKSKLHIEDHMSQDTTEKSAEKKKGNRISRLMRFWKSKEKLSNS